MTATHQAVPDLTYRVHLSDPHAHTFDVEIELAQPPSDTLIVSLPAWIPGSYMIRDFARNLVAIDAYAPDGTPLALKKRDKQTWVCEDVKGAVRIRYRVFAWDLSVRAAHLDQTHAYFNGPALLLRVHGLDHQPCRVELLPPDDPACADWRVATSLRPLGAEPLGFGSYQAASYDDLIDHPVEMGRFRHLHFDVLGVPHRLAITGRHQVDEVRLVADLVKICEQHAVLFGELPLDRYLFLVTALGEGYGGLEHAYSTSLICVRDDLVAPEAPTATDGYTRFLGLCSHEYFHLWNVKRIRPQAFVEGGLEGEVHTRLLWAFEGITSYYDELALVRCSCIDHKAYLGLLANTITRVMRTPGRYAQTLAEASFDAWTKFYKPDENAPNALVSYYAKGSLVALALDLTLRRDTWNRVSLDDVMRELWRVHGRTGVGVPERGVEEIAERISGLDLDNFFNVALDSTEDLNLAGLLASVGIEMRLRPARGAKDWGGCVDCFDPVDAELTLDVRLRPGTSEAVMQNVIAGGAGALAGLAPGDAMIAIDGLRTTAENLERQIAKARPCEGGVTLHVFRRDELMVLRAQPRLAAADTCELRLMDSASPDVLGARAAWFASSVRGA